MKALISGGGIGGLTAALCLQQSGVEVEIYERAPEMMPFGAGIQVSPNGVRVLHALGLGEQLKAFAFCPEGLEMRLGPSGRRVFMIPTQEDAVRRHGAPHYHMHRADMTEVLSTALRARAPGALHMGREAVGADQDETGVTLRFADGSTARGDVLVGADGIHSVLRSQLFGADKPRFTGCIAWRLVIPASRLEPGVIPPNGTVWVGPGRHAVTYYLRRGELLNFVGLVEQEGWHTESWTERGDRDALAADFEGWAPPLQSVIAEAGDVFRWALFDRDPMPSWSKGRITLLGDACHPMLPFLAQGAVMAIEDGWVLAASLKEGRDIPSALAAYEAKRKPRTASVQLGARRQMGLFHKRTFVEQLTTYGPMWLAARLAPSFMKSRQDWIYSHDVTAPAG